MGRRRPIGMPFPSFRSIGRRLPMGKGRSYPFHPDGDNDEAIFRCLRAKLEQEAPLNPRSRCLAKMKELCNNLQEIKECYSYSQEEDPRSLDPDDLAGLDPEEIRRRRHKYFVMTGAKKRLSSWETQGGRWETRWSMRAIHGKQAQYIGAKRVLQFYQQDGTPTDWHMDVYFPITPNQNGEQGFCIEEDMVACRVWELKPRSTCDHDGFFPVEEENREHRFGGLEEVNREHREEIQFPWPQAIVTNLSILTSIPPSISNSTLSTVSLKCRCSVLQAHMQLRVTIAEGVQTSTATQQVPSGKSKRARPPDGKSEVWQHFTKIHTEDPDVVYAACHCCDIMLHAHPKKHGTNHLRRHSETCRHKQHVREEMKQRCLQEMKQKLSLSDYNADLGRLDPWDLPSLFIMGHKNQPPSLDTQSGFWKEKERSFVAICDHRLNDRPVYFAVKKTLEFYQGRQDGNSTKTDWLMTKYFWLHPYNDRPGDFILKDENVMCKVFQEDKDVRPSAYKDLERYLEEEEYKGELCPELEDKLKEYMTSFGDCLVDEGASSDEAPPKKRPRYGASSSGESDVWHRFSKIFNKDHVLLYGVCHSCHTMLKAPVKNGTSSLRRHGEKCSYKSLVPNPVGSSSSSCSSSLVFSR